MLAQLRVPANEASILVRPIVVRTSTYRRRVAGLADVVLGWLRSCSILYKERLTVRTWNVDATGEEAIAMYRT